MTESTINRAPFWRRIVALYRYLRSQEPAMLIAFWRALLGVALAAGIAVPDWVDTRVSALIGAVWVVLTFWQGKATRDRVVPADNVPDQFYASHQPPNAR